MNTEPKDLLAGVVLDPTAEKTLRTFASILALADLHIVSGEYLRLAQDAFNRLHPEGKEGS